MKPPLLIHLGAMGICLCVAAQSGVHAEAGATAASEAETFASVELRPGKFRLREDPTPGRALDIVVSIPRQTLFLLDAARLVAVSSVSTGRRGHSTPTGAFTVLQKKKKHFSNLYDNAPMPFMQRLTWGGVALHAGHIPGYPASHGCIRLPREFARHLYGLTRVGSRVVVTNDAFPPMAPLIPTLTEVLLREWQKLHPTTTMVALHEPPVVAAPPASGAIAEQVDASSPATSASMPPEAFAVPPDQGSSAIADSSRP